ncbi:helix-turn-helix transcriptional regulator [Bacillus sp. AGMB 02131]|uniref:Helix-turn-helix transcriptional regulator n=1 Tax=Peribacillus faecalis TaxID=2772559 RepID=A0A927HCU6_9BACI|nr:helix-turn-helix transcriptional regulator [Peribacillus faecalis]MBD3110409.1 helix-turn-helix transcriptional regulator [Peribacillus faecalis]
MNGIGKRIRKLRKEKKLTLETLSGDQLSKSMLSLIENGKAQPSMESLHFIASRLGVEVNALLQDDDSEEVRLLLDKVEQLMAEANTVEMYEPIEKLIEPQIPNLQKRNYENARLLDLYARLAYVTGSYKEESHMRDAITRYKELNMFNHVIDCYIHLCWRQFEQRHYKEALQFLHEAEAHTEGKQHFINNLTKLDMHYMLTIMYLAVDDIERAMEHLQEGIKLSKEDKIFYRIDDLYRFMLIRAIMDCDEKAAEYYILKLEQYSDFADDTAVKVSLNFIKAHYLNQFKKEFDEALTLLEETVKSHKDVISSTGITGLFKVEEAYCHWALGHYEQSLELLKNEKVSEYIHHPYDLAISYQLFAIRALCYEELGQHEKAMVEITLGYNLVKPLPKNLYQSFIFDTYEKVTGMKV